jgi:hypothetical protein
MFRGGCGSLTLPSPGGRGAAAAIIKRLFISARVLVRQGKPPATAWVPVPFKDHTGRTQTVKQLFSIY